MPKMLAIVRKLHQDEFGQDLIEYVLIAALIALAATAGMNSLATGLNTAFGNISGQINSALS